MFVGREIDRGNLRNATLSRHASDLPYLAKLRLVEKQLLAVRRPGWTAGKLLFGGDAPQPGPINSDHIDLCRLLQHEIPHWSSRIPIGAEGQPPSIRRPRGARVSRRMVGEITQ